MRNTVRGGAKWFVVGLVGAAMLLACGDDDRRGRGPGGEGGAGGTAGTAGSGGSGGSGGVGGTGGEGQSRYEDPTGASGTRLSRRYLESGPGAYMTVDFWDAQFETACSFGTATDGALRCLPDSFVDLYYSDEGCTEPVYMVRAEDTFDCGTGWARSDVDGSYYRRTETPAVLTAGRFYSRSATDCSARSLGEGPEFWVAEKVVSAEFVRGTRVDEARADGMVARFVEGEDGSRVLLETVHGTRGYACSFDSEGHCLPPVAPSWAYADSGCTEIVAAYYAGLEAPGLAAIPERDSRGCQSGVRLYERGAAFTPPQLYYRNTAGACATMTAGSTYRYFRTGAEVSIDELPRASVVHEGEGTLVGRRYVDGDGEPLGAAYAFWDTARDEQCDPVELNGGFACAPAGSGYISGYEFSDALCTESSAIAVAQCLPSAPRLLLDARFFACTTARVQLDVRAAYERGADVESYYFQTDFVACEPRTPSPFVEAYAVGPEATSSLPLITLGTEE